jgi:hypothetical protein
MRIAAFAKRYISFLSMKKILLLITSVSLIFCACERHPASQIPKAEGAGEGENPPATKEAVPAATPSGTPKTYFPK